MFHSPGRNSTGKEIDLVHALKVGMDNGAILASVHLEVMASAVGQDNATVLQVKDRLAAVHLVALRQVHPEDHREHLRQDGEIDEF